MSTAGTALTVISPGWVMRPSGYVLFGVWNALLLMMAIFAFRALSHGDT